MSLSEAADPTAVSSAELAEPTSLNSLTGLNKKALRAKASKGINSYSKGHRSENACAEIFIRAGFAVHKSVRVKFQNIDIFNLFDLHCKKRGLPNYYVQVKSNETPRMKLKNEIAGFAIKFGGCEDSFEIWCVFDRKGIRRWIYGPHGWFEIEGFADIA